MTPIQCSIFLPQKMETYDKVTKVVVPSENGVMEIYPDHADCFVAVSTGDVEIFQQNGISVPVHVGEAGCYFTQNIFVLFVSE